MTNMDKEKRWLAISWERFITNTPQNTHSKATKNYGFLINHHIHSFVQKHQFSKNKKLLRKYFYLKLKLNIVFIHPLDNVLISSFFFYSKLFKNRFRTYFKRKKHSIDRISINGYQISAPYLEACTCIKYYIYT